MRVRHAIGICFILGVMATHTMTCTKGESVAVADSGGAQAKPEEVVTIAGARGYQVMSVIDMSTASRQREQIWVMVPEAKSMNELVSTAAKAAREQSHRNGASVVAARVCSSVKLLRRETLVQVQYARDSRGWTGAESWRWSVMTVDRVPTQAEVHVMEAWHDAAALYRKPDGTEDSKRIKAEVAKSLGIKASNVQFPLDASILFERSVPDNLAKVR